MIFVIILTAIILTVAAPLILIIHKSKKNNDHSHPTGQLTSSFSIVLNDRRVTPDIVPVFERLVDLIDVRCNNDYDKCHQILDDLYAEAQQSECFTNQRGAIDSVFSNADQVLQYFRDNNRPL